MKKNQAIPSVEQSEKSSEAVSIVGGNKTSEAVAVEVSLEVEKERTSISVAKTTPISEEDGCEAKTTPSRPEQAATPPGMEFSLSSSLYLCLGPIVEEHENALKRNLMKCI